MQLSRRAFLGAARPAKVVVRPPWAALEADFLSLCTRCSECIDACPTGLLVKGDGGFPEANLTPGFAPEGCTFCGDCLHACQPQALRVQPGQAPWQLHAVIDASCLTEQNVVCRTCGERCDAGAIHFPPRLGGVARPQLDVAACTGCAACIADCPTRAIRVGSPVTHSIDRRGHA